MNNFHMSNDKAYEKELMKISKTLKKLREEKGLTQHQMIEYGFNYRHYQKLESGKYSPSLYTLHRLAKVFKVELKDLL